MGVLRDDAIIPRPPEEMMDPIEWVLSPKGLNRNLYPRQATLLKLIFLRDDLFTEYDLEVLGKWAEGFRLVEPGEVPRPDGEDDLIRFESTGALCRGITPDWEDRIRLCKEEGRKWFRETIPIIGRRGSKGYMGGLSGSYVIYDYHGLGDPQGHYGVDRDKKLMAIVFAGKKEQAKINQWQDLVNVLVGSPYFQPWIENSLGESLSIRTPWDNKRVRELTAAGVQTSMDMATFSIVPKESTLMAGRGPTSFLQFYDEMAHVVATGANRSAEEVYQAATPSLDQFGVNGFIYTGSSPWQMSGQMYENYLQALSVDPETRLPVRPEMLMLQLFSWDLYTDWDIAHKIEVVPKDCAKEFTSKVYQEVAPPPGWVPDPHRPLFFSMHTKTDDCKDREYERIIRVINPNSSWMAWSSKYGDTRLSEYLTQVGGGSSLDLDLPTLWNPIRVPMSAYDRQMQRLERANPDTFRVERLSQWASALNAYLDLRKIEAMFGPWRGRILEMQHQGILGTTYVAHGDPSKSGANFGFAIAHLEGPDENGYMHVVFDHLGAWQPQDYEDATIDYIMVEAEIISLARRFMPSDLTFDQFNSAGMIQRIQMALNQMNLPKRTMVYERTATAPVNWRMAETFKTALNMGLIHAPYFELAELELRFLQLTASQRVDHPTSGPVQTKDVADAMFNVVYHLIGEQMGAFLKQDLAASLPVGSHSGGFPMPANSPLGGARKEDVLSRLSFGSGPLDISRIPRRRR